MNTLDSKCSHNVSIGCSLNITRRLVNCHMSLLLLLLIVSFLHSRSSTIKFDYLVNVVTVDITTKVLGKQNLRQKKTLFQLFKTNKQTKQIKTVFQSFFFKKGSTLIIVIFNLIISLRPALLKLGKKNFSFS